jgi:aminoglycoside 2''-phosphotransferase
LKKPQVAVVEEKPLLVESFDVPLRQRKVRGVPTRTPTIDVPFVGYRFLEGVAADSIDDKRLGRCALARVLGQVLGGIHRDGDDIGAVNIPTTVEDPVACLQSLLRDASVVRPEISPELSGETREAWLTGTAGVPPPYAESPRLIHNDICPDHILVDPPTGQPLALLDFGDVAFGDPVIDFVGPFVWLGESFVKQVLESYETEIGVGFWDRLRFYAKAKALVWLGEAKSQGQAVDKHQRPPPHALSPEEHRRK